MGVLHSFEHIVQAASTFPFFVCLSLFTLYFIYFYFLPFLVSFWKDSPEEEKNFKLEGGFHAVIHLVPFSWRKRILRFIAPPTLLFTRFLYHIGLYNVDGWWTLIEPNLFLGSIPLPSDIKKLKEDRIIAIVNLCEEMLGPTNLYDENKIAYLHLPTLDVSPPTLPHILKGIAFIDQHIKDGGVLIHCRAGKGRSTTLLLCYLLSQDESLSRAKAQKLIEEKRRCVSKNVWDRPIVKLYEQRQRLRGLDD